MIQLFVFQHILGNTVHQWDASACLVDRHRSSQEKQWRSGRVRPVVRGVAEEVRICFKVYFPFCQVNGLHTAVFSFFNHAKQIKSSPFR